MSLMARTGTKAVGETRANEGTASQPGATNPRLVMPSVCRLSASTTGGSSLDSP